MTIRTRVSAVFFWRPPAAYGLFLGVRDDIFNEIRVIDDGEVRAPSLVDSGLPQISGLLVFLGMERWVLEVSGQESKLLFESPLDVSWGIIEGFDRPIGKGQPSLAFRLSCA